MDDDNVTLIVARDEGYEGIREPLYWAKSRAEADALVLLLNGASYDSRFRVIEARRPLVTITEPRNAR